MLIVNADDLAMTPGANAGIFKGFDEGIITHASIMANCDYFDEAIDGIKQRPELGIGIHFNLTYGRSLTENPLISDSNGLFNLSYSQLLLNKDEKFLEAVEAEWKAQINKVKQNINKKITHIDSHRHIHLIPHIYPIVVKIAKQYNIQRIRLVKENFLNSLLLTKKANFFLNGGIIKYILLKSFSYINAKNDDFYKDILFYSILYTGVISKEIILKLESRPDTYEIMVHPSITELDLNIKFYDENEKEYRVSNDRKSELKAVLR